MSIWTKLRDRRRERIITKYLNSNGMVLARRPAHLWFPHWLSGDYTMKNSELIFAAVSRISNSLSAMPIQLYKGAKPVYDELNDMVSFAPNSIMTSTQFFKTMEACRGTAGDCYALKVFAPGSAVPRLDVLDPTKVKPVIEQSSGELWWRIQPDTGKEMYVHDWYMVHIPFISTNGIGGISPVSVLFDTLKYSQSIQIFNAEQLEHGVNSAIVLEAPSNLGQDQKKAVVEDFMETYRETSGNILLLESGVQAKTLNLSPVDSKLFEVEKITRSKVAMVYNIPPHLLGDYSDTSFSSQEQQMLEFLMQSALKMTESQYKTNANSIEALTAKDRALNNLLEVQKQKVTEVEAGLKNAQQAEAQYAAKKEELTQKIEENCRALEELKSQSGDTTDEQKKLTEENERLNEQLSENESYLKAAKRAVTNWKTDLNKAKTAVNETENAIRENSEALEANKNKTKANADAINALAAAMVASGLKAAIREITEALWECVDASVDFESAMAGVAKTTNMSDDELAVMAEDIKKLSTEMPVAATELAGIVEVAGQLGIAKEDLLSFSVVMANLGVSTNMTSEEAATMLARFANVTKMAPAMYENLGSVVVALGNNFATTESEIVTMGQRLAAAGELAGLTEPEIMALAAAMSSVGIQAEAGGTAMTQTLTAMEQAVATGGSGLEKFASVAGMSAEQFASTWESKPIEAIEAFINGLGRLDEQGESATLVLEEMGLSGIRQGNMLKSLATASGLLTDAVGLANTAWTENTALMKEATTRYETTESKFKMFENSVTALKIAVGDQLTPALADLADEGTDVVQWATEFVQANEWLAPAISAVSAALSVLLGFVATATVVIPLLTKLFTALGASFLATPAGMVAAGIAAVTAAAVTLAAALPSTTKEADDLRESMEDCAKAFEDAEKTYTDTTKSVDATAKVLDAYISRLEELESQTSLTDEEQMEYNRLVGEVARIMPEANTAINETTGLLEAGATALRVNAEEWKNMAQAAAESARIEAMTKGLTDAYVALYTAQDDLTVLTRTASDNTLTYASSLQDLYAAQANFNSVQKDSSSDYWEVEAAYQAVEDAQQRLIESAAGLSEEEKETGQAIAALKDEVSAAEENVASYEERISALSETMSGTGDAAQETADGIERTTTALENAGEISGEGIANGFSNGIQGMSDAAEEEMVSTEEVISSSGEAIVVTASDIGTQSAEGFKAEFDTMSDSANAALSDAMQAVRGYTAEAYSAGYSVGSAIGDGAAVGVRARAWQVAQEAAAMVRNAIAAAKAEAQSNSPSKKTMQLGRDLDEGVIIGIDELEGKVIEQMKDTMRKVTSVEVKAPEIPEMPDPVFRALNGGNDSRLADALNKVAERKPDITVQVTQHIHAEDTSYAGQQREAKRRMQAIARELSR